MVSTWLEADTTMETVLSYWIFFHKLVERLYFLSVSPTAIWLRRRSFCKLGTQTVIDFKVVNSKFS